MNNNILDFTVMKPYIPILLEGAKWTIYLTLAAVGIGIVLGLIAALMKMSRIKVVHFLGVVYIELIRGTPMLVQIFLIYFGLPQLIGFNIPAFPAAVSALGINSGAYVAEIIRAGIQAIDIGQTEASSSLGMSNFMTMRYIIIPQAIKNILPALVNEFITLIKDSSIVSVIGLEELMRKSDIIRSITYRSFEPLITIALIYFVMTFTLSKFMGKIEGRLKRSDYR